MVNLVGVNNSVDKPIKRQARVRFRNFNFETNDYEDDEIIINYETVNVGERAEYDDIEKEIINSNIDINDVYFYKILRLLFS